MMCERKKLAVIILTLCVILGGFRSKAEDKEEDVVYYKYYTNIIIQPGDTLWDLADDYLEYYESKEVYIQEVSQLNSIQNGKIVSGRNLIMPYFSTEYKL